jgi:transcriptional regulator with XRE-family HTH domain
MNVVSGESPGDRLARALAGGAVPEQFRRAFTSIPPDPLPGQLWRARRDDTSMLVLLTQVEPTAVDAVPVTMDDDYSTADSVLLERDASPLGVSLTVWPELGKTLPMRVLENYAGDLELDGAGIDPLGAVRAAGRLGRPASSPADPVLEYQARIRDDSAFMAGISEPSGSGTLPNILADGRLRTAELAQILGVSPAEVLSLRRGERPISPAEAARLAPVLGLARDDLVAANPAPPNKLLVQVAHPRRRAQIVTLARVKDISEDEAFARAAFDTYALAARASGDPEGAEAWNARLDRYFQMVLDD